MERYKDATQMLVSRYHKRSLRLPVQKRSGSPLLLASLCLLGTATAGHAQSYASGPVLTIDARFDRHGISQDIYGVNAVGMDANFANFVKEVKIPMNRSGGDATTRYNWQMDATNAGGDWYFMAGGNAASVTPGGSVDSFVAANKAAGAKSIVTIPVIPFINAVPATTWDCSFPVSLFGDQQDVNPFVHPIVNGVQTDAGNGYRLSDGSQILLSQSDILRINVANTPSYQKQWVQHLVTTNGTANNGGVAIYQLDNEPSGWGNTHRDVHPDPTGYDELIGGIPASGGNPAIIGSVDYAKAIKAADPTAAVLGPGDFGMAVYQDGGAPGDDKIAHGGMGFADYYLMRMRQESQKAGRRLLDYFDEHYYPIPDNPSPADPSPEPIALSPAGKASTQARRLQATRSLWDPTYVENNWIGGNFGPIQLIPRFREWVAAGYPGTKIAITEYNFGGLESINGALAQADVLGIFGREAVDLATMWAPPAPTDPGAYAFRMYRNYDGKGGEFGDVSIRATSKDQSRLSVYAALRSTDNAMTIMVINKTNSTLTSNLNLQGFKFGSSAKVYRYSTANLNAIIPQKDVKLSIYGFSLGYPPNSITLFVIPLQPAITPGI